MNPIRRIIVVSLLVICAGFNLPVHGGETGDLIGTVKTPSGKPVSYANVILLGTNMGASATRLGSFVVPRVPPGRYSIRVAASGYALIETTGVEIQPGVNTEIHFTTEKTPPDTTATTIPPFMLTPISSWESRSSTPPEYPIDTFVDYPDSLSAIQAFGLDFQARYQATTVEESTIVSVVAFGENNSEHVINLCGTFVFVALPYKLHGSVPVPLSPIARASPKPTLKIRGVVPTTSSLDCRTEFLAPGDITGDTLTFQYVTAPFSEYPGEVRLWCLYYCGESGAPWSETEALDIGVLVIPIW
jgi:hypothetical protein